METRILQATDENIAKCARLLREGEVVAFPTETVYGLGASALSDSAARKIFAAKGRPATNPLIIHVADKDQIDAVAVVDELSRKLIDALMPGALTLVMPKPGRADIVTAGFDTVAVRMPDHPVALKLISEAGVRCARPRQTPARGLRPRWRSTCTTTFRGASPSYSTAASARWVWRARYST